mmetsp:Transcript_57095/g.105565  ORF Transcript_57095/g.105565 Transcript_57095/m.105565 type:complete len:148 (-) Transcript_57095:36-479(-)
MLRQLGVTVVLCMGAHALHDMQRLQQPIDFVSPWTYNTSVEIEEGLTYPAASEFDAELEAKYVNHTNNALEDLTFTADFLEPNPSVEGRPLDEQKIAKEETENRLTDEYLHDVFPNVAHDDLFNFSMDRPFNGDPEHKHSELPAELQ